MLQRARVARAHHPRSPPHRRYGRLLRNKDVSGYSSRDLSAILGKVHEPAASDDGGGGSSGGVAAAAVMPVVAGRKRMRTRSMGDADESGPRGDEGGGDGEAAIDDAAVGKGAGGGHADGDGEPGASKRAKRDGEDKEARRQRRRERKAAKAAAAVAAAEQGGRSGDEASHFVVGGHDLRRPRRDSIASTGSHSRGRR